jgi:putative toxin-antitoxin system antitoxin component (TIGR02293 family)
MTALAERLQRAANEADLDASDLARIIEAQPRTVSRWLNREVEPRADARERLLELIAVLEKLSQTLKPDAAHDWLFTPNRALDYHKPVELIRQGEVRRVLAAIDALAEGVFV